jgi:hypothetical protein
MQTVSLLLSARHSPKAPIAIVNKDVSNYIELCYDLVYLYERRIAIEVV